MCTCGVTTSFASIRTKVLTGSFERKNTGARGSCGFGVLQKISRRTPSTHLLWFVGLTSQGQPASLRLKMAHTWLGAAHVWKLSLARVSIQGMGTGREG